MTKSTATQSAFFCICVSFGATTLLARNAVHAHVPLGNSHFHSFWGLKKKCFFQHDAHPVQAYYAPQPIERHLSQDEIHSLRRVLDNRGVESKADFFHVYGLLKKWMFKI